MPSPPPRRRWPRYGAVATIVILGVALASLVWWQPMAAALVCPRCFGFQRLAGDLFVDRAMPPDRRDALQAAMADAERRLRSAYGELRAHPTVLACGSEACWRRVGGGGARGVAYGTSGLRLSPRGLNAVIIAHERSHIELHGRIGLWRFVRGAVPAWFDEGFAVIVSEDDRYLLPASAGDRCRAEPGTDLPSSLREWPRQAGADQTLYARAACRVSRWMARHGGTDGVLAALDRIAAGGRLEAVLDE